MRTLFIIILFTAFFNAKASNPVKVIITAGQSNTEGRVINTKLPDYILNLADAKYKHCKWTFGSTTQPITGVFSPFWPSIFNENNPHRWAYDAVTYYWLEQAWQEDFYVIKWALGGTAIDTSAVSNSGYYWQADPVWLSRTTSTATGGKSLLLSFEENIAASIDNTLSKLDRDYEIVAFLWHQGESDRKMGENYYNNLKRMLAHVRHFLVEKTSNDKYSQLPFICGTVSSFNKSYSDKVEKAMWQLSGEDENFHVVDMSQGELQNDQLHFTEVSAEYLGVEIYNTLVEIGVVGNKTKKIDLKIRPINEDAPFRVAKYKGDKACAISYTFDDGLKEHYTLVVPQLEKYGFNGTFWINGSRINLDNVNVKDTTRLSWLELKEMSDRGHEISNHGWAHKNFARHTLDEIREDIYKNDSAIFVNVGIMPRTFCYPNNNKAPEGMKIAVENRVGTRTKQRSIGSKSTSDDLDKWVRTLIKTNDWGVGMTHGINYGYDSFRQPDILWNHLSKVKSLEDSIWVDTFFEVASYTKERDNIVCEVVKKEKDSWHIMPKLSLDKNLFTAYLTMIMDEKNVKKAKVKQNGVELKTQIYPEKVIFDFDPNGGLIEVDLE